MEILELVTDRVILRGVSPKSMVLPHCTWDKFGEILADEEEDRLDYLMS